jgi:2-polyprenyl-6-methoxyphenol hydroxylase-like FAD-dependent oxidoreductase
MPDRAAMNWDGISSDRDATATAAAPGRAAAPAAKELTPVLIVGGGFAGLASALFLSHHGVPSVLVDRHPGVSIQGRARGINQRTMEIYRPLGIEALIKEAGRPFDEDSGVVRCESLAGEWNWLLADESRAPLPDLTPCGFGMADQRSVEPILIAAARERGADIRFGTQCVAVVPDIGGVTAIVENLGTGARRTIRADYLIAADGFRGTIGRRVGINRTGPGVIQHWVTFIIEADLREIVQKRAMLWIVVNDDIGLGSFLTTSVPNQWAVSVTFDPERDSVADFTPERCLQVARSVIGADIQATIVDIASWEEAVEVADCYRSGRIFLVGDSGHVWPPAGAMGANAAVQDAHNLAWKLAAVINRWAGVGLLDSYEAERRPVARALVDITVRRQQTRFGEQPNEDDVDDTRCALGQRYRSAAVIGAVHRGVYGGDLMQGAAPGTRAPHLWVEHGGRRISVHDLFHDAFVLLAGAQGAGWIDAADRLEGLVPLRAFRVGPAPSGAELVDVEGTWRSRYGLGHVGAVLVRPDGYVAWRAGSSAGNRSARLAAALRTILASRD